jgi:ABC-type polysaccharide transport system permease subunit
MYGLQIAFKDYQIRYGFLNSPWAGLKHFKQFVGSYYFPHASFPPEKGDRVPGSAL